MRKRGQSSNTRHILDRRPDGTKYVDKGYDGDNIPDDFEIPSSDIEDIDRAFFDLFDKTLNIHISVNGRPKKVPTIFAGGERFALTKSGRPIRDRQGAIIVPVISIRRTSISNGADPKLAFGVDPGTFTIHRRLGERDRLYQRIVNNYDIENQDNIASSQVPTDGKSIASRRIDKKITLDGSLYSPLTKNIVETIVVPTPDFFTLNYDVTIWTNYVTELNTIIERIMRGYDVGTMFTTRIESPKGYWYVAYFGDSWSMGDNFDDYTSQHRLVKASISVKVPGWTFAGRGPGELSPFRSYVSAPNIEFDVCESDFIVESVVGRLPLMGVPNDASIVSEVYDVGPDGRIEVNRKGSGIVTRVKMYNPFASDDVPRFASVKCVSKKGERVGRIGDAVRLTKLTK